MRRRTLAAAMLGAGVAVPAAARVIDYAMDGAAFAAIAEELKITPFTPSPPRGRYDVALEGASAADHVTKALGMYCSAYKIENPAGALMARLAADWDRDGIVGAGFSAAGPHMTIRLTGASSHRRCVEISEYNVRCISQVSLNGEAEVTEGGATRRFPVSGAAERDASVGGICGSIARGIGVVTREAGLALIADAERKAGAS